MTPLPWPKRRAWLVLRSATVPGALLSWWLPAGKLPETLRGFAAAVALAAEFGTQELGPRKYNPGAGRAKGWTVEDGGFGARALASGDAIVVQGPPDDTGALPDWRALEHREQVASEYPGVYELKEPAE